MLMAAPFTTAKKQKQPKCPGFPGGSVVKESACQFRRHRSDPRVRKIPWRREWKPTSVFLSEKSHGQRSLAGYRAWVCKSQT